MLYNYEDDKELIFAAGTNFRLGCVTFSTINKFHLVTRDKKNISNKHVILLEALFLQPRKHNTAFQMNGSKKIVKIDKISFFSSSSLSTYSNLQAWQVLEKDL